MLVDSDNALGSLFGDVDDAFAIAALLRSGARVSAISSVAGNTSERRAFDNNRDLAKRCGYEGPLLRGSEVAEFLRANPGTRVLALGPLTNVAAALRAGAELGEVIVVGWKPRDFNPRKDWRAAREVFDANIPLTIFPQDVAAKLFARRADLKALEGEIGNHLARGARRWLIRLRLLAWTGRFPIYDLAAALYTLDPRGFTFTTQGTRKVCVALDRDQLWKRAIRAFSSGLGAEGAEGG